MPLLDRRTLLATVPALMVLPRLAAQVTAPPFRCRHLNHVTLAVSDLQIRMRTADAVGDPDGILVHVQDVRYCGGFGTLGEVCPAVK